MTETYAVADQGVGELSARPVEPRPDMSRLVRILASRVLAGLPRDTGIEMADLIQAGNLGLLQAERSFKPENGAPLWGYAKFRIRGEMLDAVRRNSRPARAGIMTQGSTAEDGVDLEAMIPASSDYSPFSVLARNQRAAILDEEVARLPERYRAVVRMRYASEFSLREIGEALSVHESRACQLHQSALGHLRRALSRRGVRSLSTLM